MSATDIDEYGGDRRLRPVLELPPAARGAGDGLEGLAVGLVVDLHLQVVALHTVFGCGELEGDTYSLAKWNPLGPQATIKHVKIGNQPTIQKGKRFASHPNLPCSTSWQSYVLESRHFSAQDES